VEEDFSHSSEGDNYVIQQDSVGVSHLCLWESGGGPVSDIYVDSSSSVEALLEETHKHGGGGSPQVSGAGEGSSLNVTSPLEEARGGGGSYVPGRLEEPVLVSGESGREREVIVSGR